MAHTSLASLHPNNNKKGRAVYWCDPHGKIPGRGGRGVLSHANP